VAVTFAQELRAAADRVADRPPLGDAMAALLNSHADSFDNFGVLNSNALTLARRINGLHDSTGATS
jgi:hypothetical protein